MSRPRRCRRICEKPAYESFIPDGIPAKERVILRVEEYETIRLIDLEKLTHEECGRQMGVSRTTVTEMYEAAREKLADCIVNGKPLLISGGDYTVCGGNLKACCPRCCCKAGRIGDMLKTKGENVMRIAVTYENGEVFQHFGHSQQFKLYDIEDGKIVSEQVMDTNGQGHGALAGFLSGAQADILICGGIGMGAQNALSEAGIKLYGGVSGSADEAVKAFLAGNLEFDADVHCNHHHEEGHSCGGHQCGEDKHGCHGHG